MSWRRIWQSYDYGTVTGRLAIVFMPLGYVKGTIDGSFMSDPVQNAMCYGLVGLGYGFLAAASHPLWPLLAVSAAVGSYGKKRQLG